MNCTKVEKLLPLYVEGDLSNRDGGAVRAHLSSCDACRALTEEFQASQERIYNFAAPDFGTEFYEGLRGAVMAEITARPLKRPSLFERLLPLSLARPAMAVSFALLILLGALTFAAYRALLKQEGGQASVAIERGMGEFNLEQVTAALERAERGGLVESSAGTSQPVVSPVTVARQKPVRDYRRETRRAGGAAAGKDEASLMAAATAPQSNSGREPVTGSATPTQAIARMEIQTSDPNIRIIWLAPKASE